MREYMPLDHPRFQRVQRAIFTRRVVADCMTHGCALVRENDRQKLDACCQYGADVDLGERDAILARRADIEPLLHPTARDRPWFEDAVTRDPDFPSGAFVRSARHEHGCLFLAHDQRGCAIHRAALEGAWDARGVKPHICRLFPLSYESDAIVLSDDYADYSCAYVPTAPTVYRAGRQTLADVFGPPLVRALDLAEVAVE